jgi:hypothetical protein
MDLMTDFDEVIRRMEMRGGYENVVRFLKPLRRIAGAVDKGDDCEILDTTLGELDDLEFAVDQVYNRTSDAFDYAVDCVYAVLKDRLQCFGTIAELYGVRVPTEVKGKIPERMLRAVCAKHLNAYTGRSCVFVKAKYDNGGDLNFYFRVIPKVESPASIGEDV